MIEPKEVSILDSNSAWQGVETSTLMENAGKAMAEEIVAYCDVCRVTFVCGAGNNGGDGFVAARSINDLGYEVRVVLMKSPENIGTDLAKNAFQSLPEDVHTYILGKDLDTSSFGALLSDSDVLVDALLGAGAMGEPRGNYWEAVRIMNGSGVPIMSVDMPSGIGFEPCIKARVTVTFHEAKTNMYVDGLPHPYCGEIVVKDIGIPAAASIYMGSGDLKRYPALPEDAKKGDGGRVLVIGGGPFTGAPALASIAALKAGANLVRVAVPIGISDTIASYSMDLIVERLRTKDPYRIDAGCLNRLMELVRWADCVLVGPGAGNDDETLDTLARIITYALQEGSRIVVDADGITAVSGRFSSTTKMSKTPGHILFTPHRGELMRLLEGLNVISEGKKISDPYKRAKGVVIDMNGRLMDAVASFCRSHRAEVLMKGPVDVIVSSETHSLGERIQMPTKHGIISRRLNDTGHPAMSAGGTGDILSGLCTGFIARGMTTFDAAGLAAFVNGLAGERTFREIGHSLSAEEMLARIRIEK
ncbi:MAG: NAD(P)H-hydrate dehydratase [Thermoplasmatota archaeon]